MNAPAPLLEHSLVDELPGMYARVEPHAYPSPELILLNEGLAAELGLDPRRLAAEGARWFGGHGRVPGSEPVAVAYAGHQFGHLNPQLGDGRAVLLGEVPSPSGRRFDLQLKGSGRTPFSRGGDGRAALDSVLREYVVSEAMHALRIPTTRALAAVTTGETVTRYRTSPGAVLARVASSHLRVGTLEYLAVRGDVEQRRRVVDYALTRHFPEHLDADNPAKALLEQVADVQADLVARWMLVGFVHGVMNTDNMALSGETLDYGPCAFMEVTDPDTVFSILDSQGRYAYGRQPSIAMWNLARLAESLLPVLADDEPAAIAIGQAALERFRDRYDTAWTHGMCGKLGLEAREAADVELMTDLLAHMHRKELDYTSTFRRLSDDLRTGSTALGDPSLAGWNIRWRGRLRRDDPAAVAASMDRVNPLYIPRNHRLEAALDHAVAGDLAPVKEMLEVLARPFEVQPGREDYAGAAPSDFGTYQTHCNT